MFLYMILGIKKKKKKKGIPGSQKYLKLIEKSHYRNRPIGKNK